MKIKHERMFYKNKLTKLMAVAFLGTIVFSTQPARADDDDLTKHHLNYGVSQFWAGTHGALRPGRYANPTPVNMVVATLIYHVINIEDQLAGDDLQRISEKFLSCVVLELTPHAAVYLDEDVFEAGIPMPGGFDDDGPYYSEIISAPRDGRLADGLGILAQDGTQQASMRAVHPRLFSLPSDTVLLGQRQTAIDCVCNGLFGLDMPVPIPSDIFSAFGIVGDTSGYCVAVAARDEDEDD